MIVIGDTVPHVLQQITGSDGLHTDRAFLIALSATVAILPLCLMRVRRPLRRLGAILASPRGAAESRNAVRASAPQDMAKLAWSSMLSVAAVLVIVVAVIAKAPPTAAALGISAATEPAPFAVARPRTLFAGVGACAGRTAEESLVPSTAARPLAQRASG